MYLEDLCHKSRERSNRASRKALFSDTCAYCGQKPKHLTIDHFIPKSRGGKDIPSNYIPACLSCNGKKKNHLPWDWYYRQSFFSELRWKKILDAIQSP